MKRLRQKQIRQNHLVPVIVMKYYFAAALATCSLAVRALYLDLRQREGGGGGGEAGSSSTNASSGAHAVSLALGASGGSGGIGGSAVSSGSGGRGGHGYGGGGPGASGDPGRAVALVPRARPSPGRRRTCHRRGPAVDRGADVCTTEWQRRRPSRGRPQRDVRHVERLPHGAPMRFAEQLIGAVGALRLRRQGFIQRRQRRNDWRRRSMLQELPQTLQTLQTQRRLQQF